jgi:DNA-binding MarR family transcriptional regulator
MTHAVSAGLCGDVSADADAQRVRMLIFMVSKSVMRDLDRRLDASGAGISGPQYGVMRLLSQENATITELSSRMMLAPATLVPVVDTLERKGFVQRGVDPKDRRRVPLLLTDAGAEVVTRVAVVNGPDSLAQGLNGLGHVKAQQLQALLLELVNQFTEDDAVLDRASALNLNDLPRT